jgi:hypothetical protein
MPLYREMPGPEAQVIPSVEELPLYDESQTQPETQLVSVSNAQEKDLMSDLKRKDARPANDQETRKTKKVKVSIGAAVDLGD